MYLPELLADLERRDQFAMLGHKLPAGPSSPNPVRAAGLELMQRRRLEGAAPAVLRDERGESFACALVAVPELDWQVHTRRNPELISKDRETRKRAWRKFVREFGPMYGCDASVGKRAPATATSRIHIK